MPPGTNPGTTSHGYTGHRHNNTGTPDLGLIYMNARYYLPEIGRFISADTIVPEPENPQSYNRFSYALNSPTNLTDPSGHSPTSGCDYEGCSSDPDTWGQNFVAYMAQKQDRFSQAVTATYLDYYNPFAAIIEVKPELVEYTLWQMAYESTAKLQAAIDNGGWFTKAMADVFGNGYLDAFDVVEGSIGVILATTKLGNDSSRSPAAYSVAFETQLPDDAFPGRSRGYHNQIANQDLLETLDANPNFAKSMEDLVPDLRNQLIGNRGGISRRPPAGWTWHHSDQTGTMQLVPRWQHESPLYRNLFHPGGRGGYSFWGD